MILVSSFVCLCPIYWSRVLSREWRCSQSSADRRCPNYIWVINNSIAYKCASYIIDLTVVDFVYGMGYRNWYQDWGHCGVTNDPGSSPQPSGDDLGSSPQPEGEARGLWWASRVVGDTTMTESRYKFIFYHDASKHIKSMQIGVCICIRKSPIKLFQISHYG